MKLKFLFLLSMVTLIFIVNCAMNQDNALIYKKWQFVKYDIVNFDNKTDVSFSSKDTIQFMDLTDKDTLKFFINHKNTPVLISYRIIDSTLIMHGEEQEIKYKIWKLTKEELELVIQRPDVTDIKRSDTNLITMFFKIK